MIVNTPTKNDNTSNAIKFLVTASPTVSDADTETAKRISWRRRTTSPIGERTRMPVAYLSRNGVSYSKVTIGPEYPACTRVGILQKVRNGEHSCERRCARSYFFV